MATHLKIAVCCISLLAFGFMATLSLYKLHSSPQVLRIFGRALDKAKPRRFEFPQEYHVTGRLLLPHSKIEEPFEAWFSRKHNRSRIDYYYG